MANKKYYVSETIEFQNGDETVAKQLTIKKLKLLNEIFADHEKRTQEDRKRITKAVNEAKNKKNFDEDQVIEDALAEIEKEGNSLSYIDVLTAAALVALNAWGVKDQKGRKVEVDAEYIEENLDYPTITRICEIGGSMELGNTGDDEGKAQS